MKKYFFLLLLIPFLLFSCKQSGTKDNENSDSTNVSQNEDIAEEVEFNEQINTELKKYLTEVQISKLEQASTEYNSIKTAEQLAKFYIVTLQEIQDILNQGISKSNPDVVYSGDYAPVESWMFLRKDFPFVIVELMCSECDASAIINFYPLIQKSKETPEDFDDLFFETLKLSYFQEWYEPEIFYDGGGNNENWYVMDGCDFCSYSTLGMGTIYDILSKLQMCENKSDVFNEKTTNLKQQIVYSFTASHFGAKKEDVLTELDLILQNIEFNESAKEIVDMAKPYIKDLDKSHFNCAERWL